jgi:hypothetical protein
MFALDHLEDNTIAWPGAVWGAAPVRYVDVEIDAVS